LRIVRRGTGSVVTLREVRIRRDDGASLSLSEQPFLAEGEGWQPRHVHPHEGAGLVEPVAAK
jgi:hypothetical protein